MFDSPGFKMLLFMLGQMRDQRIQELKALNPLESPHRILRAQGATDVLDTLIDKTRLTELITNE